MNVAIDDGLAVVEFDDEPTRNALTQAGMQRLCLLCLEIAEDPDTFALMLVGVGSCSFSSGANVDVIEDLWAMEVADIRKHLAVWQAATTALQRLEKPVVAAVNGLCIGGGAELALACDIRVAAPGASFRFPEARLGLAPDMGASTRLAHIVGLGRAKHLLMTAEPVDAQQAFDMGLVTAVLDGDDFQAAARTWVRATFAEASPVAAGQTKRLIDRNFSSEAESGLERELLVQSALYHGADVREGYRAFREKRPPRFTKTAGESAR